MPVSEPDAARTGGFRLSLLGLLALVGIVVVAATPLRAHEVTDLVSRTSLRVCADPADMPMSDREGRGFGNKIAELLAESLDLPLDYVWFPHVTHGWYRNTLGARVCDITMNIVSGADPVQNTNHYYRSAWVLLYREDDESLQDVETLTDARLKDKRIGVIAGTAPATHLLNNGLMPRAEPYPLMVDRRHYSPSENMIADVTDGTIDAGILWGPSAGYFVQETGAPLVMVPLVNEKSRPHLAYRMTFGVRPGEVNWRHELNRFIAAHQEELHAILREYNVPLLDENNRPLEVAAADGEGAEGGGPVPEPMGYREDEYQAPVPETLTGAMVLDTMTAESLWKDGRAVFIDVLPRPEKPENLPEDTVWRDPQHEHIAGSTWLPNVGYGSLSGETEEYFRRNLEDLAEGTEGAPLVFYCKTDCWMSWNAAKRALEMGHANVAWYPGGADEWKAAGLPMEPAVPAE